MITPVFVVRLELGFRFVPTLTVVHLFIRSTPREIQRYSGSPTDSRQLVVAMSMDFLIECLGHQ